MPVAAANGIEINYTVEGATHASNVTHPDEVNQATLGFLSGLGGR